MNRYLRLREIIYLFDYDETYLIEKDSHGRQKLNETFSELVKEKEFTKYWDYYVLNLTTDKNDKNKNNNHSAIIWITVSKEVLF